MFNRKIFLYASFFFLVNLPILTSQGQSQTIIINKLAEGLGNSASINSSRFIMFSSAMNNNGFLKGEHTFLYDRETKECRFEGETKEGQQLIVLFNSGTNSGDVYIDEKKTDSPEIMKTVVSLFLDDSYYLFLPLMIATKKVPSTAQVSEIIDSKRYYVIKVNSPTSKFDSSILYIDSQTGTISMWETFDSSDKRTQDLLISKTKDVGGGLILATKFTDRMNGKSFEYPIVAAFLNIEPEKFKTR